MAPRPWAEPEQLIFLNGYLSYLDIVAEKQADHDDTKLNKFFNSTTADWFKNWPEIDACIASNKLPAEAVRSDDYNDKWTRDHNKTYKAAINARSKRLKERYRNQYQKATNNGAAQRKTVKQLVAMKPKHLRLHKVEELYQVKYKEKVDALLEEALGDDKGGGDDGSDEEVEGGAAWKAADEKTHTWKTRMVVKKAWLEETDEVKEEIKKEMEKEKNDKIAMLEGTKECLERWSTLVVTGGPTPVHKEKIMHTFGENQDGRDYCQAYQQDMHALDNSYIGWLKEHGVHGRQQLAADPDSVASDVDQEGPGPAHDGTSDKLISFDNRDNDESAQLISFDNRDDESANPLPKDPLTPVPYSTDILSSSSPSTGTVIDHPSNTGIVATNDTNGSQQQLDLDNRSGQIDGDFNFPQQWDRIPDINTGSQILVTETNWGAIQLPFFNFDQLPATNVSGGSTASISAPGTMLAPSSSLVNGFVFQNGPFLSTPSSYDSGPQQANGVLSMPSPQPLVPLSFANMSQSAAEANCDVVAQDSTRAHDPVLQEGSQSFPMTRPALTDHGVRESAENDVGSGHGGSGRGRGRGRGRGGRGGNAGTGGADLNQEEFDQVQDGVANPAQSQPEDTSSTPPSNSPDTTSGNQAGEDRPADPPMARIKCVIKPTKDIDGAVRALPGEAAAARAAAQALRSESASSKGKAPEPRSASSKRRCCQVFLGDISPAALNCRWLRDISHSKPRGHLSRKTDYVSDLEKNQQNGDISRSVYWQGEIGVLVLDGMAAEEDHEVLQKAGILRKRYASAVH
ncbi:hypothetical protein FPV67DRAFT_1445824 [Lyophyllum atratum]|nr:hypothetical protein FPV67DRAFT_1445824 [Lyophyllum atratum]